VPIVTEEHVSFFGVTYRIPQVEYGQAVTVVAVNVGGALIPAARADISKVPKSEKILNGDIEEEAADYQVKTLVSQLQSDKAHEQYHMIQQLHTDVDVSESELLHAPIWFVRYDYKGNKIVLVIDGKSGNVINSIGLEKPRGNSFSSP
jgi:hypothetical protein